MVSYTSITIMYWYALRSVYSTDCGTGKEGFVRMKRNLLVALCLLLLVFTGCGQKAEETAQQPEAATEAPDVQETEETPVETTVRYDIMVVNTPYGDLYYQEQWSDNMVVEQKEEGDLVRVSFLAKFNGLKYALFDLVIGGGEEESVATITDAAGTVRNVSVNFLELGEYPELSEDDQNQLYAMQEDINYVIENIK